MLQSSFRKKVKIIHEKDLPKYLQEDYRTYLPDEMGGLANTDQLVEDFVTYRYFVEEQTGVANTTPEWYQ